MLKYEWIESGRSYREFLLPAEVLNRFGPPVLVNESEEDLDSYLQLALKAQSQYRATLETRATIKNPPAVFAQQANIAQGPQQLNNGMMPAGEPRAGPRETEIAPDKLLEAKPHERLDTGTPDAAGGSDSAIAVSGTFDGAEVRRR